MINVVTSFFNKTKCHKYNVNQLNARNDEYNTCLLNNLKNESIEKLHLFIEDEYSLNILNDILETNSHFKNKVTTVLFNKQPLYSDFFEYSNEKLKDKIVMITNSDIYLESSDNDKLNNFVKNEKNIFCLTRHEYDDSKPLIDNFCNSHDSFIFHSPLNVEIIEKSNFYQNILGAENVINYLLGKNNYKLYNPCFQFKIKHLHNSGVRLYDTNRWLNNTNFMPGYKDKLVPPCYI